MLLHKMRKIYSSENCIVINTQFTRKIRNGQQTDEKRTVIPLKSTQVLDTFTHRRVHGRNVKKGEREIEK